MGYKFTSQARWTLAAVAASATLLFATITSAQFQVLQVPSNTAATAAAATALAARCPGLPNSTALKSALSAVVAANVANPAAAPGSGGLNLNMWGSVVNRKGEVCAVVFTGTDAYSQWPGSRVISAQKANTANAFSLPLVLALSTANLFFPAQNGQSLYGLQLSNPVDPTVAYAGDSADYGTSKDGMIGKKVGGVNVFGGGLALYAATTGTLVGGLGVSGDTSCADHIIAWRTRSALKLDNVPGGVGPASGLKSSSDNMINDLVVNAAEIGGFSSQTKFGHPTCSTASTAIVLGLVTELPIGSHP